MKKYNKKIVSDYIFGNDIENYSIDELENNRDFMMLVVNETNDKRFYNLCSEELKQDYIFVKYLVLKFKDDINFICNVANHYLSNSKEELEKLELNIIMTELTIKNKEINMKYRLIVDTTYVTKRVQIEIAKRQLKDPDLDYDIGMGFLVIFDSFSGNEIILSYYAKRIINEILNEHDKGLEDMLHKEFKIPEQIDKVGINNYMLKFIGYYDSMLASYLSSHIDLMKELKQKLISIQKNWNEYELIKEREKYNLIIEKVHEYMEEIETNTIFTETDMLYYVGRELGIAETIAKYEGISDEIYDLLTNDRDYEFFQREIKNNPKVAFYYKKIMNIVSSILFSNNTYDNDTQSSISKDCKVLKIDFNKRKNN